MNPDVPPVMYAIVYTMIAGALMLAGLGCIVWAVVT